MYLNHAKRVLVPGTQRKVVSGAKMLLVSGRSPVPEFLVVFICLLFWARKKDGVSSKSNGWFNNGNSVSPCTSSSSSLVFIGHLDRKQLYKTVVLSICFGKIGTCTIQIH